MKTEAKWVLGTMSGTSLDGVDAALILTDGTRVLERGETAFRPYSDAEREILVSALGKWPGQEGVAAAAALVETAHGEVMMRFEEAEVFAFHGQTLAHDPANGRTHQAGDGRVLAELLSRPVVWDFRSNDMQMGGQGAPLAPAYHFALAKDTVAEGVVAVLNLGGVGNLTLADTTKALPEEDGALLAFDTGPANAPLNDLVSERLGLAFDEGGQLAAAGRADEAIVSQFLDHSYFLKVPPKSLDRNDFNGLSAAVSGLSTEDAAATLVEAAAAAVAAGLTHAEKPPKRVYATGGGRKNSVLLSRIAALSRCPVEPIEALGADGDMVEAEAFAYLAARVMAGLPTSFPGTTGVAAAIGGGQVSHPRAGS